MQAHRLPTIKFIITTTVITLILLIKITGRIRGPTTSSKAASATVTQEVQLADTLLTTLANDYKKLIQLHTPSSEE